MHFFVESSVLVRTALSIFKANESRCCNAFGRVLEVSTISTIFETTEREMKKRTLLLHQSQKKLKERLATELEVCQMGSQRKAFVQIAAKNIVVKKIKTLK